jgi:hypothetical protein
MMGFVVAVPLTHLVFVHQSSVIAGSSMVFFRPECRYADALAGGIAAMAFPWYRILVNHQLLPGCSAVRFVAEYLTAKFDIGNA